jgi:hypothetical protein
MGNQETKQVPLVNTDIMIHMVTVAVVVYYGYWHLMWAFCCSHFKFVHYIVKWLYYMSTQEIPQQTNQYWHIIFHVLVWVSLYILTTLGHHQVICL